MKRQTLRAWLGGTLALLALGSATGLSTINASAAAEKPAARTESRALQPTYNYHFNFEDSLGPWKATTDSVEWTTVTRGEGDDGCTDAGYYFANLASNKPISNKPVSGMIPQPVGTWMLVHLNVPVPTSEIPGPLRIQVDWAASSRNKSCEGCVVAAYAGLTPPTSSGQFQYDGVLPAQGWKNYHASFDVAQFPAGDFYVAIGWLGIDAAVGIDCVNITVGK